MPKRFVPGSIGKMPRHLLHSRIYRCDCHAALYCIQGKTEGKIGIRASVCARVCVCDAIIFITVKHTGLFLHRLCRDNACASLYFLAYCVASPYLILSLNGKKIHFCIFQGAKPILNTQKSHRIMTVARETTSRHAIIESLYVMVVRRQNCTAHLCMFVSV